MTTRKINKVFRSIPTIEGAGVHLKRAFGYSQVPLFDPFLMLDDFHTANPAEYLAGFPWHPHRGSKPLPMSLRGWSSMVTAWETKGLSAPAMCSG